MASIISALSSAFSSILNLDPPRRDYSPSPSDIHAARLALLRLLPLELVDAILHLAAYYTRLSVASSSPATIKSDRFCYLQSPAVTGPVRRVTIAVESHDQGWSSYPEDWGTLENSWTWFSAVVKGGNGEARGRWDVIRNRHACKEWQRYEVVWEGLEDHPVMRALRVGDRIEIWPEARYPGWVNFVRYASVEILCWI